MTEYECPVCGRNDVVSHSNICYSTYMDGRKETVLVRIKPFNDKAKPTRIILNGHSTATVEYEDGNVEVFGRDVD
jgi:hypothetical protein